MLRIHHHFFLLIVNFDFSIFDSQGQSVDFFYALRFLKLKRSIRYGGGGGWVGVRRGFKRIERIVFDASSYTPLLTIHIKSRLFIQNIIAYYTFAAFWATMHPICSLQCTTECVCKGGRGTRDRRFSLDVNYWEERKIHRSSASYFSLSLSFFYFLFFFDL